jgi:hypothetical protein
MIMKIGNLVRLKLGSDSMRTGEIPAPSVVDVCFCHFASFRCAAKFGRYRRHCGHCSGLALNGSVANDPKRTFDAATQQKTPDDAEALNSPKISDRISILS